MKSFRNLDRNLAREPENIYIYIYLRWRGEVGKARRSSLSKVFRREPGLLRRYGFTQASERAARRRFYIFTAGESWARRGEGRVAATVKAFPKFLAGKTQ